MTTFKQNKKLHFFKQYISF